MITFQCRTNSVLFLAQYMIRFEAHSFTHKDANCLILVVREKIQNISVGSAMAYPGSNVTPFIGPCLGPVSSTRLLEHIKCGCGFVSRQLLGSFLSSLSFQH